MQDGKPTTDNLNEKPTTDNGKPGNRIYRLSVAGCPF
jgi:hypothetical protein